MTRGRTRSPAVAVLAKDGPDGAAGQVAVQSCRPEMRLYSQTRAGRGIDPSKPADANDRRLPRPKAGRPAPRLGSASCLKTGSRAAAR